MKIIEALLYQEDIKIVENIVIKINDPITLHIFIYNYNWDDGFSIPRLIVDNIACDIGTALMIFDLAQGYSYFSFNRNMNNIDKEWFDFVNYLHGRITKLDFKNQNIMYIPELTKVQIYKLKKNNPSINEVFLFGTKGEVVNIPRI